MANFYLGLWAIVFSLSIGLLVKASGWFIKYAEKLGLQLKIPPFLVGMVIVSIGTSLPELASSLIAAWEKSGSFVLGNILGSNIANILLVLGIAAVFHKGTLRIPRQIRKIDSFILLGSAFIFFIISLDGKITLSEGMFTAGIYLFYIVYSSLTYKRQYLELERKAKGFFAKDWIAFGAAALGLLLGAKYTVDSIIHISRTANIDSEVLSATIVALGTSLPEAIVVFKAARLGKTSIALGNILGSNIFNIMAIIGIASLFTTISVPSDITSFFLPAMIGASFLYFLFARDGKVTNREGLLLLGLYLLFLVKSFYLS